MRNYRTSLTIQLCITLLLVLGISLPAQAYFPGAKIAYSSCDPKANPAQDYLVTDAHKKSCSSRGVTRDTFKVGITFNPADPLFDKVFPDNPAPLKTALDALAPKTVEIMGDHSDLIYPIARVTFEVRYEQGFACVYAYPQKPTNEWMVDQEYPTRFDQIKGTYDNMNIPGNLAKTRDEDKVGTRDERSLQHNCVNAPPPIVPVKDPTWGPLISDICTKYDTSISNYDVPFTGIVVTCIEQTMMRLLSPAPEYTDADGIHHVSSSFFGAVQSGLANSIRALMALYIIIFSYRLMLGKAVPKKNEWSGLALKFALVGYFTLGTGMAYWFPQLMSASKGLSAIFLEAGLTDTYDPAYYALKQEANAALSKAQQLQADADKAKQDLNVLINNNQASGVVAQLQANLADLQFQLQNAQQDLAAAQAHLTNITPFYQSAKATYDACVAGGGTAQLNLVSKTVLLAQECATVKDASGKLHTVCDSLSHSGQLAQVGSPIAVPTVTAPVVPTTTSPSISPLPVQTSMPSTMPSQTSMPSTVPTQTPVHPPVPSAPTPVVNCMTAETQATFNDYNVTKAAVDNDQIVVNNLTQQIHDLQAQLAQYHVPTNGEMQAALLLTQTLQEQADAAMQHANELQTQVQNLVTNGALTDSDNRYHYCDFRGYTYKSGYEYMNLWDMIDCKLSKYLGIGDNPKSRGAPMALYIGINSLFGSSLGIFILFFTVVDVVWLIMLVVRIVHIYIIAFIGALLLAYISPLVIPSILFEKTKFVFQGWLKQFIALLIQPVILFAFLGMGFYLLDFVVYGKNYAFDSNNRVILKSQPDTCFDENTLGCVYRTVKMGDDDLLGSIGLASVGDAVAKIDILGMNFNGMNVEFKSEKQAGWMLVGLLAVFGMSYVIYLALGTIQQMSAKMTGAMAGGAASMSNTPMASPGQIATKIGGTVSKVGQRVFMKGAELGQAVTFKAANRTLEAVTNPTSALGSTKDTGGDLMKQGNDAGGDASKGMDTASSMTSNNTAGDGGSAGGSSGGSKSSTSSDDSGAKKPGGGGDKGADKDAAAPSDDGGGGSTPQPPADGGGGGGGEGGSGGSAPPGAG